MKIDLNYTIKLQPPRSKLPIIFDLQCLRRFMRELGDTGWSREKITDFFDGYDLTDKLVSEGWIELNDEGRYEETRAGSQLRVMKFIRRITRAEAEQIVESMLERVEKINADHDLLYYVHEIWAFGSYVTDAADLGDIDLVLRLKRKHNGSDHSSAVENRIKALGLRSLTNQYAHKKSGYFENEVVRLVGGRNRHISLMKDGGPDTHPEWNWRRIYP